MGKEFVVLVSGPSGFNKLTIEVQGEEDARKVGEAIASYVQSIRKLRSSQKQIELPGRPWWEK